MPESRTDWLLEMEMCVYVLVFVHMCRTCCLLQAVLCSHSWLFMEGLYPLPNFFLGDCLGRWTGSCLWHCTLRHHGSGVIRIVLDQLEEVSGEWEPDPSCWHGQDALAAWCGSEVASDGFAQAQVGYWPCFFTLAVPRSPLTSFLCSQDQCVGWLCLMGTQEQTVNSPCCWTQGCCCRSIYSIYLELLSALQLLPTQINVSFLSLYFLQCWQVAELLSVGAVLSLELRNNFPPLISWKFLTSPSLHLLQRMWLFCASAS